MQKYLAIILDASAALFEILMNVCQIGKKVEQHKQTEEALKAAKTRLKIEDEINKKSDDNVRSDLSNWLRDK
ncbi:hypothetical protein [Bartonella schoenbuchensis]|uniref:Uncharacterized protein n=2 Tax=Bartonella schoenbuchensis TaxID=165694 RepID=E6YZS5_BARSR|nr:hypothetical protein BscR1v2_008990 [Bartonella schoenbuchensis R1]ENN91096.1 hypothetical protein m07a_11080 [Bartonella schoenbuchensis m07a]CBI82363.1 conserved hypothetical protein [Bartonella schoenbuchensis R1]